MARTIFASETQVNSLSLATAAGTFPISSLVINAAVGQLPTCQVTVMQGMNVTSGGDTPSPYAMIGTKASVNFSTSSGAYVLMSGRIGGKTSAISTSAAAVELKATYQIMAEAAFLDGIPLGEMYFVSHEDGSGNTAVKSAFNRSTGSLWNAISPKPEVNLASAVAKMIDRLGENGKSVGLGASLSATLNTSTCPTMRLIYPTTSPLARALESRILEIIGGTPVFAAYCSIIRNFFLEVVPDFPGSNGSLMKVIPKIAWAKKAKVNLDTSYVTGSSAMYSGKGRNEIDGVAVKYTLSPGGLNPSGSEDLRLTAVYAECAGTNGPRLVKDVKQLQNANARLLTVPLPFFVAYAMKDMTKEANVIRPGNNRATSTKSAKTETNWAKRWAEIIAQMTFAAANRSGNTMNISMPFMKFLQIRGYLGEVISVEVPWKPATGGMIGARGGVERKFGYFNSWHLTADISGDKIAFVGAISLICVRDQQENEALGIDESLLYG